MTVITTTARTWEDVAAARAGGASVVAGGTTFLVRSAGRRQRPPGHIVVLHGIVGGTALVLQDDDVLVGAAAPLARLESGSAEADPLPAVLGAAVRDIGFPQMRRTATVGGSLCNGVVASQLRAVLAATGSSVVTRTAEGSETTSPLAADPDVVPPADRVVTAIRVPTAAAAARQAWRTFPRTSSHGGVAVAVVADVLRIAGVSGPRAFAWTAAPGEVPLDQAEADDAAGSAFDALQDAGLRPGSRAATTILRNTVIRAVREALFGAIAAGGEGSA